MVVSEGPRRLVGQLAAPSGRDHAADRRESDAGYRVALSVCQAPAQHALGRAAARPARRRRRPLAAL